MESVDVAALVRELAELFEDELKRKQITLIVSDLLPSITCEKARLRQVFQNLIDNAIKYMGDNPIREIEIGHHISQNEAEFYVRDTGLGIHPDDLQKVFYIFRRGRNSGEVHVPGKGIGLASVKSIIETYDGRIWVESQGDRGSVFRFTIHGKFLSPPGQIANSDSEYETATAE
jgi:signal transduction histidine kinase